MSYKPKISLKGSRLLGEDFIKETTYLSELADCLEIDFNYPHDRNFKQEMDFLVNLKKHKGINYTVHSQFFSGSLNDLNENIRQETLKMAFDSIDKAKLLGASTLVLHPALEPYGLKVDKRVDLEIESYKAIAQYAQKNNQKIGLENEAQTCFWFPDRACHFDLLEKTIAQVDEKNFGFTIDVGHASVSGQDYIQALKRYSDKIYHIHIHDNYGKPEINLERCNRPDPHLAPGKGIIAWDQVIKTLTEINYPFYIELECGMEKMAEAINYLKQL